MMKRIIGAALAVAVVWLMPRLAHPAVDIGKLEPVEAVLLTETENGIRLETDTGASGEGKTLAEAVEALREGASGEVFLETADKLLICGDVSAYWQEIYGLFRPACQVCLADEEINLEEATAYLDVHPADQTLARIRGGLENWSILTMQEGRGQLVPK